MLTEREDSEQLTSKYQLVSSAAFNNENITYFFTKQATLMRRSIVLSLPLQLEFPPLRLMPIDGDQ
jgi:hypothetical protein